MKELVRFLKKIIMLIVLMPLKLFPVRKNRVLLNNDLSAKYADNPKYVAEYLINRYPAQFEIVFPVSCPEKYIELFGNKIHFIKAKSLHYFYYALTAKVFLTNGGGISYIPFHKCQYVINTWHGGGAYKKVGIHACEDSSIFEWDIRLTAGKIDVFLSTCHRFTQMVGAAFLMPEAVFWEIGMPRNDILIHENMEKRRMVRKRLQLQEDEKLVLYAPTFRHANDDPFDDFVAISYGIDPLRVCGALESRFGGKWRFAFRFHPKVAARDLFTEGAKVLNLSEYEDMQELLCTADAMINDFSSSMWDFMLTGRPSFLFAADLEHYVHTTQVYTPVSEWPFPKAVNNDELEENILRFDETVYKAACEKHYRDLGGCETGRAAELISERIYEQCFGKIS